MKIWLAGVALWCIAILIAIFADPQPVETTTSPATPRAIYEVNP